MTDMEMTAPLQQALVDKDLAPAEHLIDAGYVDAHLLVTAQTAHAMRVVGPVQPDRHWQAHVEDAYDITTFEIDWANHSVTCPQGHVSVAWLPHQDRYGNQLISVKFPRQTCLDCAARPLCTAGDVVGRRLTLHPEAEHKALQAARQAQQTAEWKAEYEARAGIEATLSQGIRGLRVTPVALHRAGQDPFAAHLDRCRHQYRACLRPPVSTSTCSHTHIAFRRPSIGCLT